MKSEIRHIHHELQDGRLTCTALVRGRIEALESSTCNTANYLLTGQALEMAAKVDEKVRAGQEIGLLEGIPFGLKDVYLLQGSPASASSDFLRNYTSPYTATAVQKLVDAGAIPIVKENCDSFGHGSSNENSAFGPVKNALDENLVPGGSSGGSAVNVSKGYTVFSIGGDTGGSIRQPAGFNQVYGLKPTYGRISRYGLMAYASSTDCVGPIARTLEDIRIVLNTMSGKDVRDQTSFDSLQVPGDIFGREFRGEGLTIGYYRNFIEDGALDPEIKQDFLGLMERLGKSGMRIKPLDFFNRDVLVSTYYVIAMAETASNLARLDGMNFGERLTAGTLRQGYALTRSENFTEETKRRIIGGTQVLSHGHAEEIYVKARALREKITRSFARDFLEVDLIVSPVSPDMPPKIGASLDDPLRMYLSDAYTVGFSLGGLPTLTAPTGAGTGIQSSGSTGTGIQITAPKNGEPLILQFAHLLTGLE